MLRSLGQRDEAERAAREAIRLGPEEVGVYETLWKIAAVAGGRNAMDALEHYILRLDPTHEFALSQQTAKAAKAPGTKASEAAALYADALAAVPGSTSLSHGLDRATYRLLRGTRRLALLCLALAGAMADLLAVEGEVQKALPMPLGTRLRSLVPMTAIWAFGARRRYRTLRTGVRLNLSSLVRRGFWARIVLGQAAWAILCALVITQLPWTQRPVPQVLFWAGMSPTADTIWFDQAKTK
ncbi:hypothetical protein [Streptomyces sp. NPDC058086]|uniref:hypothetical protein n=1 Tax=Streptomyces sp. NPDC058086 TaxID=3346334 RepID=UPI0036E97BA8